MEFGKNLKGSLVIGLILAGFVLVINPEARKEPLGVLAAGMILAETNNDKEAAASRLTEIRLRPSGLCPNRSISSRCVSDISANKK